MRRTYEDMAALKYKVELIGIAQIKLIPTTM